MTLNIRGFEAAFGQLLLYYIRLSIYFILEYFFINMKKQQGVISVGIRMPIVKEGDNLAKMVVDSVLDATLDDQYYVTIEDPSTKNGFYNEKVNVYDLNDRDVIGITESIVARTMGNYVTVDEIAEEIHNKYGNPNEIIVMNPIYSRNRFSMILKALARATGRYVTIVMPEFDEVGNPSEVNQFTGVNIKKYYIDIIEKEGRFAKIIQTKSLNEYKNWYSNIDKALSIYCGLHDFAEVKKQYAGLNNFITLADICADKCEYGVLGSNKATEEKLKLFPNTAAGDLLVYEIQEKIFDITGKKVEVMIYGDGCFKDPIGGIWEFADPVVSPSFTEGLIGRPNEIKIKAFADDKFSELKGQELNKAIKKEIKTKESNLIGNMASQGTTPRRYVDLLGSLMDLTSGSGDKGCPVVLVKNYFKSYADD